MAFARKLHPHGARVGVRVWFYSVDRLRLSIAPINAKQITTQCVTEFNNSGFGGAVNFLSMASPLIGPDRLGSTIEDVGGSALKFGAYQFFKTASQTMVRTPFGSMSGFVSETIEAVAKDAVFRRRLLRLAFRFLCTLVAQTLGLTQPARQISRLIRAIFEESVGGRNGRFPAAGFPEHYPWILSTTVVGGSSDVFRRRRLSLRDQACELLCLRSGRHFGGIVGNATWRRNRCRKQVFEAGAALET